MQVLILSVFLVRQIKYGLRDLETMRQIYITILVQIYVFFFNLIYLYFFHYISNTNIFEKQIQPPPRPPLPPKVVQRIRMSMDLYPRKPIKWAPCIAVPLRCDTHSPPRKPRAAVVTVVGRRAVGPAEFIPLNYLGTSKWAHHHWCHREITNPFYPSSITPNRSCASLRPHPALPSTETSFSPKPTIGVSPSLHHPINF